MGRTFSSKQVASTHAWKLTPGPLRRKYQWKKRHKNERFFAPRPAACSSRRWGVKLCCTAREILCRCSVCTSARVLVFLDGLPICSLPFFLLVRACGCAETRVSVCSHAIGLHLYACAGGCLNLRLTRWDLNQFQSAATN